MFEIIQKHQLNIMLALCAVCAMMAVLLLFTRLLPKRRRVILIIMELIATMLLGFDRAAYLYKGDMSHTGYIMVRLSNCMVFVLTSAVVLSFDLYLMDLLLSDGRIGKVPFRLKAVAVGAAAGIVMAAAAHFMGLFYYFDEHNIYHRGPLFLVSYIVPVVCPIVQFTVIQSYRKVFSRLIYISLVLYIFVPIAVGIMQIFTYGLSLVNMAMVLVSVFLYIFNYLDINAAAEKAHAERVNDLQREQRSMKRLFDQTVNAFVKTVEMHDSYSEGHSVRVAELAEKIAGIAGRDEKLREEVYYAALLHDVGMMGIPDSILKNPDKLTESELELRKRKPVISGEILENISEYPYLRQGARYCCERYDGTGYPEGLKGREIPEIARIIAVADAYDTMISGKRSHSPMSVQVVREEFVKMSGSQFDPEFADIMVGIMDKETENSHDEISDEETSMVCGRYRDNVSAGIAVTDEVTRITFECEKNDTRGEGFSAPSVIVFDAYDRHTHTDEKTIAAYRYSEFGELWFDGHYVSTAARNISVKVTENSRHVSAYEITAGRFEDHISINMVSPEYTVEVIVALPDNSRYSYIGLTGENCAINGIKVEKTGETVSEGDIRKIVSRITYTDRLESDLPNIQADHTRAAATAGVAVTDVVHFDFHTMSLPAAELVWHCPYIVLFYSDDGQVYGENYREYTLIKLNGEVSGGEFAENNFKMKKTDSFAGWDEWKRKNKDGLECSVKLVRRGSKITLYTENMGIVIENTTVLHDGEKEVYAALTGDQVALTDIRIR